MVRTEKSSGVQPDVHIKTDAKRGQWGKKVEFLLSCLGYAVGIGNVWRFPYLCYQSGGGAFLIPYLIMLFLCGIPLFFLETALGQFSSLGAMKIYKISPIFYGIGFGVLLVNTIVCSYYSVIVSYALLYVYLSFNAELPWATCENEWNTPNCMELSINSNKSVLLNTTAKVSSDEFFRNSILNMSSGLEETTMIVWRLLIVAVITWAIIFVCVCRGIKSVGKVVYFTATFPFVVLIILLIRGVTLPGAYNGIMFYIWPDWNKLKDVKVWGQAAIQIFFSLGPGWGGILTMASYNKFHFNSYRASLILPMINSGTSIFAGFVVFSVLGFMSEVTKTPMKYVVDEGPGLAFIVYPQAVALMPLSPLWSFLFFFMLFILGMGTLIVQVETVVTSIMDYFPGKPKLKVLLAFFTCLLMFLMALPCLTNSGIYLLHLLDWFSASLTIIVSCLCEVVIVGWIYGCGRFMRDLQFMTKKWFTPFWPFMWMILTPGLLLGTLVILARTMNSVKYGIYEYPSWGLAIGWGSSLISLLCLPIYMIYMCNKHKKQVTKLFQHTEGWGPIDPIIRKDWQKYCQEHPVNKYSFIDSTLRNVFRIKRNKV